MGLDGGWRRGDHRVVPRKRGGASFGPYEAVERGALTCPNCHGGGKVAKPGVGQVRTSDRPNTLIDDDALDDCPECRGAGQVSPA
jgi:hypothetical protein